MALIRKEDVLDMLKNARSDMIYPSWYQVLTQRIDLLQTYGERRTCKNVGTDYADCDQFVCSECGIELQDWHTVERCEDGEVIFHEYEFRFCPNCGRRIEEGADDENAKGTVK